MGCECMPRSSWQSWRAKIALVLPLLYMGVIFYLSAQQSLSLPIRVWDKSLHAVEYFALSFLLFGSFFYGLEQSARRSAYFAIAVCLLYGLIDELHQAFVPRRDCSALDFLADAVGAIAAQVVIALGRALWARGRRRYP
jgi:VanZ family protein